MYFYAQDYLRSCSVYYLRSLASSVNCVIFESMDYSCCLNSLMVHKSDEIILSDHIMYKSKFH